MHKSKIVAITFHENFTITIRRNNGSFRTYFPKTLSALRVMNTLDEAEKSSGAPFPAHWVGTGTRYIIIN